MKYKCLLFFLLAVVASCPAQVLQQTKVIGSSNANTLGENYLIVYDVSFDYDSLKIGDLILFREFDGNYTNHFIVHKYRDGSFLCKGTNRFEADKTRLTFCNYIGKVVRVIRESGEILEFD